MKWTVIETRLLSSLSKSATASLRLSDDQKIKWQISVTEMEVRQGLLKRPADGNRCICFQRDIKDFPAPIDTDKAERRLIGRFIELSDSNNLEIDHGVEKKIANLRSAVKQAGAKQEVYVQPWAKNGITEETHHAYIKSFGEAFYDRMTCGFDIALSKQRKVEPIATEAATHLAFAEKRGLTFFGRQGLVERGCNYLSNRQNSKPFVIYGASGSGKTSVVSAIALKAAAIFSSLQPVVVTRFCGTTSSSSSARLLIKGISEQVCKAYGVNYSLPVYFPELAKTFESCLEYASEETPLVILVDSLDQLSDEDQGRRDLAWLPLNLPEHVYLIVSTLPDTGGSYNALRQTDISENHYLQVNQITIHEAKDIIAGSLQHTNRTLQSGQFEQLLTYSTDYSEEVPTVLRLRLLLDIAVKLKSSEAMPVLPVSVRGLIDHFLETLEKKHGHLLVARLFGLLAASTHGLGEDTLQDILAADDEVLDSVLQYHQPPIRRIPQVSE